MIYALKKILTQYIDLLVKIVGFYFTVQYLNAINVQLLNNMNDNPDQFNVLRKINKKSNVTQRELAGELGFSLGKLNYCLVALKTKGLIKMRNFGKNPNKINYIYVITPKGIAEKTKLTVNFMKKKMKEYDELKKEIENIKKSK